MNGYDFTTMEPDEYEQCAIHGGHWDIIGYVCCFALLLFISCFPVLT